MRTGSGLTRRGFVAGAVGAGFLLIWDPIHAGATTGTTSALTRARFEPLLNKTFTIGDASTPVRAQLVEITDLTGYPAGSPQQFSLIFQAPTSTPLLPQLVRRITPPRQSSISLFLVPVDRAVTSHRYQAVINN